MYRLQWISPLALVTVFGCGSEGGDLSGDDAGTAADLVSDTVADLPTGEATDADGSDDGADPGREDSAADLDIEVSIDADGSSADAPALECDPPKRPVGDLCRSPFDRACLADTDCRPDERCVRAESDRLNGTCIFTPAPPMVCPGGPGCAETGGALRAAFGVRNVTPPGWELAREGFGEDVDAFGNPRRFVGDVTDATTFCDCGRDFVCPPTPEFDGCLSLGTWTAADADGTEGDGYMQGAWIAGFNEGKNAGLCPADWLGSACIGPQCCVRVQAHDDVTVRGALFEQGDLRVAVLVIDTVGYFYNDVVRNLQGLPAELGIDALLFASTHTHGAPDTMGRWGPGALGADLPTDSGIVPEWMDEIDAAVRDLVTDAAARLEPVDLYAAHVRTGPDGFATRDSRDPFYFADRITALRVVRAGANADGDHTLGVLVNWHSHPEAVGSDNRLITGDFPHFMRDALERGLAEGSADGFPARAPVGGVALYLSGAVGGLLTPLGATVVDRDGASLHDDGFDKAQALGERLADAAMAALETPCADGTDAGCVVQIDPALSFAQRELILDVENVEFQAAAITLDLFHRPIYNWRFSDGSRPWNNLPKLRSAVAQLRLGALTIQTVPGELFSEVLTGFSVERASEYAIVGDPGDLNCASDLRTRLDGGLVPRFPCLVDLSNPAPPSLDAAPTTPGLYDTIPGRYLMLAGNGLDSIGYLIPSYDFVVHPDFGVLFEMPGDHYEEGVSVGDELAKILAAVDELTEALGR